MYNRICTCMCIRTTSGFAVGLSKASTWLNPAKGACAPHFERCFTIGLISERRAVDLLSLRASS